MALTITKRDVWMEAPELECDAVDHDVLDKLIAQAALEVNVAAAGSQEKANRLGVLLVAHQATGWKARKAGASGTSAPAGPLTSVSVGGVSKSFANPVESSGLSASAQLMGTTSYGREFIRLVRLWSPRAGVS
ncbi:MAG: DUF4054 domain-containing protein [Phycisphaerales bacterium]|nr:DUF4054 domain-containing protein [Chloroflexota bacterium]